MALANMENVHAVEATRLFWLNHGFETNKEHFAEARAPVLKMCTPSRREHPRGPFKTGKQLMRFLRVWANMSVSHKQKKNFEQRNSERHK
jgi:hypothetical protein